MMQRPDAKKDPRAAVFSVLYQVLEKQTSLDEALETEFGLISSLEARDKAFVRNLATIIFRNLAFIDKTLGRYLKRPLPKRALWVRHWLRIGTAQILFMDVPGFAAVDTTVEAIGRVKKPGAQAFRGLANAILRNVIRDKEKTLAGLAATPEEILPRWLRARWEDFYGLETVRAMARVHAVQPPLDLTLKRPIGYQTFQKALNAKEIFPGVLRLFPKGPVPDLAGFDEGAWWVQDLAAGLPVRLLGEIGGKTVLDLCAAPGGKTLSLAARGAKVTAVDISKPRLKRLHENLQRTKLNAKVIESDVLKFKAEKLFDFVLLDAPCSSTGTLRRHPDVAYHRGPADIKRLAEIQKAMLTHALSLLTPEGVLVYCVCSLEPEEGENLIAEFLRGTRGVKRVAIDPAELEGNDQWVTREGNLRTLPHHFAKEGGMDGFFAARLKRK